MNGCLQFSFAFYGRSIKSVARNPAIEIRGEETPDFAPDSPLSSDVSACASLRDRVRLHLLRSKPKYTLLLLLRPAHSITGPPLPF